MSKAGINRVLRDGYSCKGKAGWYKGYHCMSSWELAYVIYNLEHEMQFTQDKEWFPYTFDGHEHRYLPDFKEGGNYIEIKGYYDDRVQSKIDCFPADKNLLILDLSNIEKYLSYVVEKYGKNFIDLYENKLN